MIDMNEMLMSKMMCKHYRLIVFMNFHRNKKKLQNCE